MRGENLTQSPCLHRSGTHNLQTAECRYNFLQVLICCLSKCEEARKADDAVRVRDLEDVRDPQEGPDAEESSERDRKQVLDRKKGKTRGRKKR